MDGKMKITKNLFNTGLFSIFTLAFLCGIMAIPGQSAQAAEGKKRAPDAAVAEISIQRDDPARRAIESQLNAIRARDAEGAFAPTTDNFHEKYGSALKFLGKMRFNFRPLYNYERYSFVEPEGNNPNSTLRKVRITDHYGHKALVIYRLEKQSGNKWLIDSFMLLESDTQPI